MRHARHLSLFLAVMVGSLATACSDDHVDEPVGPRSAPIVNGQPTTGSPATVMMQDHSGAGFCSATLISPHVVLTAGHCIEGTTAADNQIFFGSQEGGPGPAIDVIDQLKNPATDMALLTLKTAGPAVPVPFFAGDLAAHINEPVHIVGFGSVNEAGEGFGPKREGMSKLLHLQGDEMFTQTALSGPISGTCYGDSGGPNYMTIGGQEFVVGEIVSGTAMCGMGEDISIRTDVYKDWIAAYVAAHEDASCAADGFCNPACPGSATNDPDCMVGPPDAGPPPAPDAAPHGTGSDAGGNGGTGDGGGCGCSVGGRGGSGVGGMLLVLGTLGLAWRRRRRG